MSKISCSNVGFGAIMGLPDEIEFVNDEFGRLFYIDMDTFSTIKAIVGSTDEAILNYFVINECLDIMKNKNLANYINKYTGKNIVMECLEALTLCNLKKSETK